MNKVLRIFIITLILIVIAFIIFFSTTPSHKKQKAQSTKSKHRATYVAKPKTATTKESKKPYQQKNTKPSVAKPVLASNKANLDADIKPTAHAFKTQSTLTAPTHKTMPAPPVQTKKLTNNNIKKMSVKKPPEILFPKTGWYVGVEGGINRISGASNPSAELTGVKYTFFTNNKQGGVHYGLYGGWTLARLTPTEFKQHLKKSSFTWLPASHFGATIWQLNNFTVNGQHQRTYPDGYSPKSSMVNYNYKLNITALELQTDLDIVEWKRLTPFIGIGFGIANVKTSDFQEGTTEQPIPTSSWILENTNNKQWIYHINIGIRYALGQNWRMQLQYTYFPISILTGRYNVNPSELKPLYFPSLTRKANMSSLLLGISYQF